MNVTCWSLALVLPSKFDSGYWPNETDSQLPGAGKKLQ